jgi:hypothetical protein
LIRPPERFRAGRDDDVDLSRLLESLRDFVVIDRRDTLFFALPRKRAAALRDLATDFLAGRRLRVAFEIALDFFTTLRTVRLAVAAIGRRFPAAFPARAPTTPPTTAPTGPARLPTAAPATAPAVCFGTGGILIFSDDCERWFFFASGFSGIDNGLPQYLTKLQKYFARQTQDRGNEIEI